MFTDDEIWSLENEKRWIKEIVTDKNISYKKTMNIYFKRSKFKGISEFKLILRVTDAGNILNIELNQDFYDNETCLAACELYNDIKNLIGNNHKLRLLETTGELKINVKSDVPVNKKETINRYKKENILEKNKDEIERLINSLNTLDITELRNSWNSITEHDLRLLDTVHMMRPSFLLSGDEAIPFFEFLNKNHWGNKETNKNKEKMMVYEFYLHPRMLGAGNEGFFRFVHFYNSMNKLGFRLGKGSGFNEIIRYVKREREKLKEKMEARK
jgi:hypothetical protein